MMLKIYKTDSMGIYTESVEIDPHAAIPPRSSLTPPPATTGTQVAQLSGKTWTVLDKYPDPPAPAPPAVPQSVTMRQARIALLGAGLLPTVNAAIANMPGIEGEAARIEWEYSQEVHRNRGLVQSLGGALGMTSEQLDALFIAAAQIQ